MKLSNEEFHRQSRNGMDPYTAPVGRSSGNGGLVALLVIVVLFGGLIVYGTIGTPPADGTSPAVGTEAPESIMGDRATETQ